MNNFTHQNPATSTGIRWGVLMMIMIGFSTGCNPSGGLGIFEEQTDIGDIQVAGTINYDAGEDTYRISGSGASSSLTIA